MKKINFFIVTIISLIVVLLSCILLILSINHDKKIEENNNTGTKTTETTTITTTTKTTTTSMSTTQTTTTTTTTSTTKKTTTTTKKPTTTTTKTTTTTTITTTAALSDEEQRVYNAIMNMKNIYPEGTPYDNTKCYQATESFSGCGCHGFALELLNAAFGGKKLKAFYENFENIKVGDLVRINESHTVVIIGITDTHYILAEGNYNSKVHWGRKITKKKLYETASWYETGY